MLDINPFWFFFLAWYAALMFILAAVQCWKRLAKRAVEKHGILLGATSDSDSHTIVTYMSDGQLTIRSEPMTPPPTVTVNSAFRLERVEEEKEVSSLTASPRQEHEERPSIS